jgi:hypothetical protein
MESAGESPTDSLHTYAHARAREIIEQYCHLAPEILEPRRRQFGISHRVLDRAVTKPILQCPCVMACVRQGVAAGVSQHVNVDRERYPGALTNALYKPIERDRLRTARARPKELSLARRCRFRWS